MSKKQPPKKPRKKAEKSKKVEMTSLQIVNRSPYENNGGQNAKTDEDRQTFLAAFEDTCGNITASCNLSGISRQTFYKWMASDAPEHIKFREDLEQIKPREKFLDIAEFGLLANLKIGDMGAIRYVLDKLGKSRSYIEKTNQTEHQLILRAVQRIEITINVQKQKQPDFVPDIKRFIQLAANDFGVNAELIEKELEKRLEEAKQL